ncbi:Peroxide stress regulator PerR, FUR family [Olavius algarvensis associated proteobacterium Delta 3]|nr:Peroxide stress regulator PerR, FUR family [Olavius algarvensis associated proteobacterium Delta 3]CAB5148680.1 Peroxide stress regulator PerR, FUR family [Olavius algarvensis associated proteobacterium Delta 3]
MEPDKRPRMTPQRKVILEALRQVDSHPSADEVYEMVRRRLPRISLGTVYRNLEMLSERGEIQKMEYGGSLKRFDGNPTEHYHIRCSCCDRIVDAPFPPMAGIDREVDKVTGYHILGHRLEFIGLCPACADNPISPGLRKLHKKPLDL